MPRQIITTPNAPSSPHFSQGVKSGSLVFVSGTKGVDPGTGGFAGSTIQSQTRQSLANCEVILQAGGASSMTSSKWAYCSPIRATSQA